jgi:methionyl-tRNA synthetase
MNKKFYITTTLPYVNADPHIGFALEIVQADVIARMKAIEGFDVFFNFGTDEHGLKIFRKAQEQHIDPKEYCDGFAAKFDELKKALNLSYNNFIRTTDPHHLSAAQEFWRRSKENGDIYKKDYEVKYCVGCELEKTDSELVDNRCPLHPNQEIEIIHEENYFFRFSKYQNELLAFYKEHPDFVIPAFRQAEITKFVSDGLSDFSISRLKSKMPWGVDVPDDSEHVMYVWFDALINYISALGWPENTEKFGNFWPGLQVAGKDNLRQQTAIWQAMLMSAGLPNSKQVFIHGFITANGQKMSKSLGNVVNPYEIVEKYGTDTTRYYLLAKVSPVEDGDFTTEKFEEAYTADLANGLGNLTSRVAKMVQNAELSVPLVTLSTSPEIIKHVEAYEFDKALFSIWERIRECDKLINEKEVWKLTGTEQKEVLSTLVTSIRQIAFDLQAFLPETAQKIGDQYNRESVQSGNPLFPRLQ